MGVENQEMEMEEVAHVKGKKKAPSCDVAGKRAIDNLVVRQLEQTGLNPRLMVESPDQLDELYADLGVDTRDIIQQREIRKNGKVK